jgi:hypothetical protein
VAAGLLSAAPQAVHLRGEARPPALDHLERCAAGPGRRRRRAVGPAVHRLLRGARDGLPERGRARRDLVRLPGRHLPHRPATTRPTSTAPTSPHCRNSKRRCCAASRPIPPARP